jgi:hypothetical protein
MPINGPTSGALLRVFHVFLDVTKLCLRFAENFLDRAFCFQGLIAYEHAGGFLDFALRFLDSTCDLILVHAHDVLLITYTGKRPARRTLLTVKIQCVADFSLCDNVPMAAHWGLGIAGARSFQTLSQADSRSARWVARNLVLTSCKAVRSPSSSAG